LNPIKKKPKRVGSKLRTNYQHMRGNWREKTERREIYYVDLVQRFGVREGRKEDY